MIVNANIWNNHLDEEPLSSKIYSKNITKTKEQFTGNTIINKDVSKYTTVSEKGVHSKLLIQYRNKNNNEIKSNLDKFSLVKHDRENNYDINNETRAMVVNVLKKQKEILSKLVVEMDEEQNVPNSIDIEFDNLVKQALFSTMKPKKTIREKYKQHEKKKEDLVPAINMVVDETQIRQALKKDPLVQRVLKIYALKNKSRFHNKIFNNQYYRKFLYYLLQIDIRLVFNRLWFPMASASRHIFVIFTTISVLHFGDFQNLEICTRNAS